MTKTIIAPDLPVTDHIRRLDALERRAGITPSFAFPLALASGWSYDPVEAAPYLEVRAGVVRLNGCVTFTSPVAVPAPDIVGPGILPISHSSVGGHSVDIGARVKVLTGSYAGQLGTVQEAGESVLIDGQTTEQFYSDSSLEAVAGTSGTTSPIAFLWVDAPTARQHALAGVARSDASLGFMNPPTVTSITINLSAACWSI